MDMLDAGINMPKMVNMVFFKPVQSKMNILTKILNLFSEKDIDKIFNNIDYFNRVLIA